MDNRIAARFLLGFRTGWAMFWRPLIFVCRQLADCSPIRQLRPMDIALDPAQLGANASNGNKPGSLYPPQPGSHERVWQGNTAIGDPKVESVHPLDDHVQALINVVMKLYPQSQLQVPDPFAVLRYGTIKNDAVIRSGHA